VSAVRNGDNNKQQITQSGAVPSDGAPAGIAPAAIPNIVTEIATKAKW
jgi:hypothetical protein